MATTAASPLVASLQPLLPENLKITLYHLSHPAIKTPSLYSSPPGKPSPPTTLESHFLTASHDGILFFAIEVLIYVITRSKSVKESTIFVSKADSTGYFPSSLASFRPKDSTITTTTTTTTNQTTKQSTLRTLTTNFISQILANHHKAYPQNVKTTISLFARASNQYLFPNSAENKNKHVLDDRGLIRWWARVLDPILQKYSPASSGTEDRASAYLLVPGLDKYETTALFPATTKYPTMYKDALRWTHGHPLKTDPKHGLSVREVIPHFPDDPKARFLDELNGVTTQADDAEKKKKKKKTVKQAVTIGSGWTNVKTLDQFWELMNFRQECSMGRCVGFIWIIIGRIKSDQIEKASDDASTADRNEGKKMGGENINNQGSQPELASAALDGAAPPLLSDTPQYSQAPPQPDTPPTHLIVPSKTYDKVTESLLRTDFGKEPYARSHTRQWVEGSASLASEAISKIKNREIKDGWDWGETLIGQLEVDTSISHNELAPVNNSINVLSVRNKKKRDIDLSNSVSAGMATENKNEANVLSPGLVRKKPKLIAEKESGINPGLPPTTGEARKENGVNVLSASLVRKKPKKD